MKLNEKQKQKLARALRAKSQPVKIQLTYAGADAAIQAFYRQAMEQIYGPEQLYEEDECWERHPYFCNRNARDWTPDAK